MVKIRIRVEEVENRDLAVFLFTPSITSEADANFERDPAVFSMSYLGTEFEIRQGVSRSEGALFAYTDLLFQAPMECDLSVFDQDPSPQVGSGSKKPGGGVAAVRYQGDSDESWLYTEDDLQIEAKQESEAAHIDSQVRARLPLVADVLSRVREAVRLELFAGAVQWDFLVESIKASQRHREAELAQMDPFLDDAAYVFAAFRPKGAARITQDSNIRYEVMDASNRVFKGEIRNTRTGKSPIEFGSSLPAIQRRLTDRGSIRDRALLAACEFLYADDFRMAVFNAATVLELALVASYESELAEGGREANKLERDLSEYKQETKASYIPALLLHYAPMRLSGDRDWEPLTKLSLDAWNYRDKTASHLTTGEQERELTRTEAWEMVTSIWFLVSDLLSDAEGV